MNLISISSRHCSICYLHLRESEEYRTRRWVAGNTEKEKKKFAVWMLANWKTTKPKKNKGCGMNSEDGERKKAMAKGYFRSPLNWIWSFYKTFVFLFLLSLSFRFFVDEKKTFSTLMNKLVPRKRSEWVALNSSKVFPVWESTLPGSCKPYRWPPKEFVMRESKREEKT